MPGKQGRPKTAVALALNHEAALVCVSCPLILDVEAYMQLLQAWIEQDVFFAGIIESFVKQVGACS